MQPPETVRPQPAPPPPAQPSEPGCTNCGAGLSGDYCTRCGQQNAPLQQPLRHFLAESFTEYFGLDGRLWTSLALLLFRPGRLTQAYLGGQRVRYLRPLRIYLSATLAFFFLLAVLDPVGSVQGLIAREMEEDHPTGPVPAADRLAEIDSTLAAFPVAVARQEVVVDSLRAVADSLQRALEAAGVAGLDAGAVERLEAALDDAQDDLDDEADDLEDLQASDDRQRQLAWQRAQLAALPPDSLIRADVWAEAAELLFADEPDVEINLPGWMPRSRPLQRLAASRTGEERAEALADFARNAIGQLPTVMFLLLPVFALLLKLIYIRRGWYYTEHLVFALHTHAFAFLVFTAVTALLWAGGGALWASVLTQLLVFSIPLYFFVAQKRVYGQGWIKTGVKALLLGWLYGFLLSLGLVLAIVLASAL